MKLLNANMNVTTNTYSYVSWNTKHSLIIAPNHAWFHGPCQLDCTTMSMYYLTYNVSQQSYSMQIWVCMHIHVCMWLCNCMCVNNVCVHTCVCVYRRYMYHACRREYITTRFSLHACGYTEKHVNMCVHVCLHLNKLVFYAQSTGPVIPGQRTLMKHACIQMNNLNRSTYQGSIHLIGVRIGVGCVDSQCHTVGKDGDQNQKLKSCELVKEINTTNIPHHINLTTSMCVWLCMSKISFLVYQTNNNNKMQATNQKQTIWNNTDSAQSLLNALLCTEAAVYNTGNSGRNLKGLVGGWWGVVYGLC